MKRNRKGQRGGGRSRNAPPRSRPNYLEGITDIDYKDHELLRRFMTEHGRILSRRVTGATAKQQRQIRSAIRRARVVGLLP